MSRCCSSRDCDISRSPSFEPRASERSVSRPSPFIARPGSAAGLISPHSFWKTSCCRAYVIQPMALRRMPDDIRRRNTLAFEPPEGGPMRKLAVLVVVLGAALAPLTRLQAAATGYHILNEIKIGGEGGWDYLTVDSVARRLYVSHATHVVVL